MDTYTAVNGDRRYFQQNPGAEFYVREKAEDEEATSELFMPGAKYVLVLQLKPGSRMRYSVYEPDATLDTEIVADKSGKKTRIRDIEMDLLDGSTKMYANLHAKES